MERATLTRPAPGALSLSRLRSAPAAAWARAGFALVCLAALAGFLAYPTYPNYDSYYSLLWGRELLGLDALSFEAYRAPTEHPLAIAFGALLALLGDGADRLVVAATVLSFLGLVWGVYRLGRVAFTPLVGAVAAALLLTRFDFPFLAARGYIDVPYMAIVVWAAVLEAERPRRGAAVFALLAAAGMLRPEAWVLTGLYFLWMAWRASWRERARYLALSAIGPLVWVTVDFAVTGDPLFSLNSTSSLAEELGRQKQLSDVPQALWAFLVKLDKFPVMLGAIAGLALAVWLTPRRSVMPLSLLLAGVGTFGLVGLAGLSVIERYLIVPSLMVMVFAAVALAGWTMLREGTLARRAWALAAAALVLYGVAFTATRVSLARLEGELRFRGDAHAALVDLLRTPAVREGLRCGPVSVPNHKLIPDVRWVLDLPEGRVVARSDRRSAARAARGGVAIFVTGRTALFKQAFTSDLDDPLIQVPGPGFERRATGPYYAAYVNC